METTLKDRFAQSLAISETLGSFGASTEALYQENLRLAIDGLEQCRQIVRNISLFSPNETFEDIASTDLQYLLLDYYLGDLTLKDNASDRKSLLHKSQEALDRFLHLLDNYRMLSKEAFTMYERFAEDKDAFALSENSDATAKRNLKIRRYREEKELKGKLQSLSQTSRSSTADDSAVRAMLIAQIELCTHQAFQTLDVISQETKILSMIPPSPPLSPDAQELDHRARERGSKDRGSDRLDPSLSRLYREGRAGPLLNKEGRPLQPFTLVDSRDRLRNGVFRPDHSLPTMTIDEYLQEERRRGGILEGSGEEPTQRQTLDEDDMRLADMQTMKAREWDEFVEANPKGSGNTINRG